MGAYAAGAGRLILVVGSQKIVSDRDAALRRIREERTRVSCGRKGVSEPYAEVTTSKVSTVVGTSRT